MRNIGGQLNWLFNAFSVVTLILTFITDIYFQPVFAWILSLGRFFVVTINDPRQETEDKHLDYV